jgi:hypothetical protein
MPERLLRRGGDIFCRIALIFSRSERSSSSELPEHGAKRRLSDLRGRDDVVRDLHDCRVWVDDPEVRDRIHPRWNVVLGSPPAVESQT